MLASWKNPEMFKVLTFYLTETDFVGLDIGDTEAPIYPPKQAMIRDCVSLQLTDSGIIPQKKQRNY